MNHDNLVTLLQKLRLWSISQNYFELAKEAEKKRLTYEQYLANLVALETEDKQQVRIQRLIKSAHFPLDRCLSTYQCKGIQGITEMQIKRLAEGDFVRKCGNVVFYGGFGVGKTHLAIGLAAELCKKEIRCLFMTTAACVDHLLTAQKELRLAHLFKKLDRYEVIVLDELGYIPQTKEGADLFFQLISQRYERRSLIITTNLTFSDWGQVFLNPITTSAAVDRIIHRCETFNIQGKSWRVSEAEKNMSKN